MPNHASAHIIGHIGRDPESDFTDNGTQRTRFNVAVNVPVDDEAAFAQPTYRKDIDD